MNNKNLDALFSGLTGTPKTSSSEMPSANKVPEAAEKAAEKAAEQTKTENTFELALTLSKKYNRSFESILDDFDVAPEERTKCMERYRNNVG